MAEFILTDPQQECVEFAGTRQYSYLGLEMGGGKTSIGIEALRHRKIAPLVIACPAVAIGMWQEAVKKHAPWIRHVQIVTSSMVKKPIGDFKYDHKTYIPGSPFCATIISYAMLVRHKEYLTTRLNDWRSRWPVTAIEKRKMAPGVHLIADEAHYLKSPDSEQSKAFFGYLARVADDITFLSGTFAPNGRPDELWPALRFCGRTELSYDDFVDRYCTTHLSRRPHGPATLVPTGPKMSTLPEFQSLLEGFLIVRDAKELAPKRLALPELTDLYVKVPPGEVDLKLDFPDEWEAGGQAYLNAIVEEERLSMGALFNKSNRDQTGFEDDLALSAADMNMPTYRKYLGLAKVDGVLDHIVEQHLVEDTTKFVVFCWHKNVLVHLANKLRQAGFEVFTIKGSDTAASRYHRSQEFEASKGPAVILGNIKAMGTALTLTSAHICYIVEASWVPSDTAQAVKRIHRIGQTKPCTVIWAVLEGDPIEERMARTLARKVRAIGRIANGPKPTTKLGISNEIFSPIVVR